jgi:hypothetical protein
MLYFSAIMQTTSRAVIERLRDNLGRQTEERWKSGASTVRSMTFGYNANGQMTSADDDGAKGRDYDWIYDQMGRVQEIRWDGFDFISIYHYQLKNSYDANSRRYQRIFHVDPDDPYTSVDVVGDYWWFDNLGRATQQQQYDNLAVHRMATCTYNAVGQLTAMDRFNYTTGWNLLVNTKWDYDGAGRIKTLEHFKADRSTLLAGYTYGWGKKGVRTVCFGTKKHCHGRICVFDDARTLSATT